MLDKENFNLNGGTPVPFKPTEVSEIETGKAISYSHLQVITGMEIYKRKSLEELRLEDYCLGYAGHSREQVEKLNNITSNLSFSSTSSYSKHEIDSYFKGIPLPIPSTSTSCQIPVPPPFPPPSWSPIITTTTATKQHSSVTCEPATGSSLNLFQLRFPYFENNSNMDQRLDMESKTGTGLDLKLSSDTTVSTPLSNSSPNPPPVKPKIYPFSSFFREKPATYSAETNFSAYDYRQNFTHTYSSPERQSIFKTSSLPIFPNQQISPPNGSWAFPSSVPKRSRNTSQSPDEGGNKKDGDSPRRKKYKISLNETGTDCKVVNTRHGYYIRPSKDFLDLLTDEDGNCFVKGFEIGRRNFGVIKFLEPVNVAGLNLDEIVHFTEDRIILYPDEALKPEPGFGLNCASEITLELVFPVDLQKNCLIKDPEKIRNLNFIEQLKQTCVKNGTEFISYDENEGVWVFRMEHF